MSGIRYAVPFHGRGTNGNNGNFGYINGGRHQLSNYANANANMQSIYANKQNFVFGNGGLGGLALLAALGVTLVALGNREKKETVEKRVEVPVEKVVEKRVEVPVEKIVEKEVVVEKEIPCDKEHKEPCADCPPVDAKTPEGTAGFEGGDE